MFWLQCYICQFFYIIFGERWSIKWWISVVWQQPKVWRILREGWVVGHAIGNWRGNWDGTFHHFLGRFLCGFGCIPPNWQILVPWLWLHTPPFYILPSDTRKGYIRGWPTLRSTFWIKIPSDIGKVYILVRIFHHFLGRFLFLSSGCTPPFYSTSCPPTQGKV